MWKEKKSPSRFERRFEFDSYHKTSEFMKRIDDLCKLSNIYPNISFGNSFVSVTVFFESAEISKKEIDFTSEIDNNYKEIIIN